MRAVSVGLCEEEARLYCIQEFIGDEVEITFYYSFTKLGLKGRERER